MAMAPEPFFAYLKHGPFAAGDWHHNRYELGACPRIRIPVLAIWGERDLYVPVNRSATVLGDCLADNADVTLTIIPGASHLITIPGVGLELPEGYMQGMVDWILVRFPGSESSADRLSPSG